MIRKEQDAKDMIILGNIATVTAGQIMTRAISKSSDEKTVPVLHTKAITDGIIDKDSLGEAVLSPKIDRDKFTKEGDIVIKMTTPYDAAYVTAEMEGIVVPSFCTVIRVIRDGIIDVKYLAAVLNTDFVREQFLAKVVGTVKPILKVSDIGKLRIAIVPAQDMKDIGEAYMLSGKKRMLLGEMIKAEKKMMESIVLSSVKEVAEYE